MQLGHVEVLTVSSDDPADFERALLTTWSRLPALVRATLETWWTGPQSRTRLPRPVFALLPGQVDGCGNGATDVMGFLYRFCGGTIKSTLAHDPDGEQLVCDLIAHELAHGYYYASGDRQSESTSLTSDAVVECREKYANRTMKEWGFTPLPGTAPSFLP